MEKSGLIEMVKRIESAGGTEDELHELVQIFMQNVPDPNAIDYIFGKEYEELTAEQIVEKALNYKPFML